MSAPLLHVDNLVKRFGGLAATDHATLQVKRGEIDEGIVSLHLLFQT